jgi:hypothetical protein
MQLMTNDALIAKLSANLKPIRGTRARMSLLIAAAAGGGTAVAIALFWPSLGPRPDLWAAALTTMFWVKVTWWPASWGTFFFVFSCKAALFLSLSLFPGLSGQEKARERERERLET